MIQPIRVWVRLFTATILLSTACNSPAEVSESPEPGASTNPNDMPADTRPDQAHQADPELSSDAGPPLMEPDAGGSMPIADASQPSMSDAGMDPMDHPDAAPRDESCTRLMECSLNGECGTCGDGEYCNEANRCIQIPEECTPRCHFGPCGPDGCGSTCGECAEGTTCTEDRNGRDNRLRRICRPDDINESTSSMCPPDPATTPVGIEPGDVVPDAALHECGSDYPINQWGLCEDIISITYQINVDCAPCFGWVNQVLIPLQNEYADAGLRTYIVFREPDECDDIRWFRDAPETMRYLYQPGIRSLLQVFGSGGRSSTTVLTEGNHLVYYGKGDTPNGPSLDMLRGLIEAALGE